MLPVINEFVKQYSLEEFIIVADSGLMNETNLIELETMGYKYIIGAKIKNENKQIKNWILSQPKEDKKWDGLKGYLTNTDISTGEIYTAYHNLWQVERAFRIAKSKIEIRPMFHFTRKRIEAHICICFVALKVYKELERILKNTNIGLSVDKVLALAETITTIEIKLPKNEQTLRKTMLMARHQRIAKLFDENFWGTQ